MKILYWSKAPLFFVEQSLKPELHTRSRSIGEHGAPAIERARTLVARLEIAVTMEDRARADVLRLEIHELPLSEAERGAVRAQLDAVQAS